MVEGIIITSPFSWGRLQATQLTEGPFVSLIVRKGVAVQMHLQNGLISEANPRCVHHFRKDSTRRSQAAKSKCQHIHLG